MQINIFEIIFNSLPEILSIAFKPLSTIFLMMFFIALIKGVFWILHIYKIRKAGLYQIDLMSGTDFEIFLEHLFLDLGYKVQRVGHLGDYGADLIIEKDNIKTAVQAKRWNSPVNIKAVQEIYTAKAHYNATESMVITNSHFTYNAKKLAKENNVELVDRSKLASLILQKTKLLNS